MTPDGEGAKARAGLRFEPFRFWGRTSRKSGRGHSSPGRKRSNTPCFICGRSKVDHTKKSNLEHLDVPCDPPRIPCQVSHIIKHRFAVRILDHAWTPPQEEGTFGSFPT